MPSGKDNNSLPELFAGTSDGYWWISEQVEQEKADKEARSKEVIQGAKKEDRGCSCGQDALERKEDRNPIFHSHWCPVYKRFNNGY